MFACNLCAMNYLCTFYSLLCTTILRHVSQNIQGCVFLYVCHRIFVVVNRVNGFVTNFLGRFISGCWHMFRLLAHVLFKLKCTVLPVALIAPFLKAYAKKSYSNGRSQRRKWLNLSTWTKSDSTLRQIPLCNSTQHDSEFQIRA